MFPFPKVSTLTSLVSHIPLMLGMMYLTPCSSRRKELNTNSSKSLTNLHHTKLRSYLRTTMSHVRIFQSLINIFSTYTSNKKKRNASSYLGWLALSTHAKKDQDMHNELWNGKGELWDNFLIQFACHHAWPKPLTRPCRIAWSNYYRQDRAQISIEAWTWLNNPIEAGKDKS